MSISFESSNQAQLYLLAKILRDGDRASPRGAPTKELLNVSFTIKKPRRRLTTLKMRKWSLPLAFGELCWHLSGSNSASFISFYAKNWSKSADSHDRISGSCYGNKLFFKPSPDNSQWEAIKNILTCDPSSRRAIATSIDIESPATIESNDISCLSSIQFLIRKGKLDCFVSMRSNDAFIGLPYDIFIFTFFQELLSLELGVQIGQYHHYASSLHIYENHEKTAQEIASKGEYDSGEMPEMKDLTSIPLLIENEALYRKMDSSKENIIRDPYWSDLSSVLKFYCKKKHNKEEIIEGIKNSVYREILYKKFF